MFTDAAEQSRNIRWGFLQRACRMESVRRSNLCQDLTTFFLGAGAWENEQRVLKSRWYDEAFYAFQNGFMSCPFPRE